MDIAGSTQSLVGDSLGSMTDLLDSIAGTIKSAKDQVNLERCRLDGGRGEQQVFYHGPRLEGLTPKTPSYQALSSSFRMSVVVS